MKAARIAGCAVLAGGMLVMRLPAQQAHARSARVFRVPCDTARLIAAINTANGLNAAVLRLAPLCTYSIQTPGRPIPACHQ